MDKWHKETKDKKKLRFAVSSGGSYEVVGGSLGPLAMNVIFKHDIKFRSPYLMRVSVCLQVYCDLESQEGRWTVSLQPREPCLSEKPLSF